MGKLAREIAQTVPQQGKILFWRLGQAGVALKMAGKLLLLDAFLSEIPGRLHPSPLAPEELENVDYVLGSHDHVDHVDRAAWPALAKASPRAKFLVPGILADGLASELGIARERFIELDDQKTVADGVFGFTGIAAAHELLQPDEETGRYACLGLVVQAEGRRVYHAGDTCPYEGLQTRLGNAGPLDVMFLPINGRDAYRLSNGIYGNLSYQEAAELAGALQPGLVVPMHYEMFTGNMENPALFADYVRVKFPQLNQRVCGIGEAVVV